MFSCQSLWPRIFISYLPSPNPPDYLLIGTDEQSSQQNHISQSLWGNKSCQLTLKLSGFFFFVIPVCGLSSLTKQFAGLPSRGASSTSQTSFGGNNLLSFMFIFHLPWFFPTPNFLWLDHLMLNLPLWCVN